MIERGHGFIWVIWVNTYCWGPRSSTFHGGNDISSDSFVVLKAQLPITTLFQLSKRFFFFFRLWVFLKSFHKTPVETMAWLLKDSFTLIYLHESIWATWVLLWGDPILGIHLCHTGFYWDLMCVCVCMWAHMDQLCSSCLNIISYLDVLKGKKIINFIFYFSSANVLPGMFSFILLTVYNVLW